METSQIAPYWAHQDDYIVNHALDPEWALLWEPRTGKTRATLGGVKRWFLEGGIRRVLIVAPKTVCSSVWAPMTDEEIINALGSDLTAGGVEVLNLYSGPIAARKRILGAGIIPNKEQGKQAPRQIAIANYDALEELCDLLLKWGVQGLVLDEGHAVKTPSANRSRAAFRLGRRAKYRRLLTGTVAPNGLIDIYGMWKVLSPLTFGTSRDKFIERYCILDQYFKVQYYRNVEELRDKAFKVASVVMRNDCFDVPAEQDVLRSLELPSKIRAMYDTIVDDHVLELQRAHTLDEIPVMHTLSRLTMLRQLATGYVRTGPERSIEWQHYEKIESTKAEALDIIESGKKVVIFHAFRPEGAEIVRALKSVRPLVLNGSVPDDERPNVIAAFKNDPDRPVIVCQENVASLGISLAAADYTIFLSSGLGHDAHKQARDRIFKPDTGGMKLAHIYPLVSGTTDGFIRRVLRDKAELEKYLLTGDRKTVFRQIALGE